MRGHKDASGRVDPGLPVIYPIRAQDPKNPSPSVPASPSGRDLSGICPSGSVGFGWTFAWTWTPPLYRGCVQVSKLNFCPVVQVCPSVSKLLPLESGLIVSKCVQVCPSGCPSARKWGVSKLMSKCVQACPSARIREGRRNRFGLRLRRRATFFLKVLSLCAEQPNSGAIFRF